MRYLFLGLVCFSLVACSSRNVTDSDEALVLEIFELLDQELVLEEELFELELEEIEGLRIKEEGSSVEEKISETPSLESHASVRDKLDVQPDLESTDSIVFEAELDAWMEEESSLDKDLDDFADWDF